MSSNYLVNTLAPIAEALGTLPAPLQAAVDGEPVPLAIGSGPALVERLTAAGVDPAEAQTMSRRALAAVCSSNGYLLAVSTDQARRVDLDGHDVGPVEAAHGLMGSNQLLTRAMRASVKGNSKPNDSSSKPKAVEPTPKPEPKPAPKPAAATTPKPILSLPAARRPGVAVRRR